MASEVNGKPSNGEEICPPESSLTCVKPCHWSPCHPPAPHAFTLCILYFLLHKNLSPTASTPTANPQDEISDVGPRPSSRDRLMLFAPWVSCTRRDVAAGRLGYEAISGVCVAVLRKTSTWAAVCCIGPVLTVDRQGERVLLDSRSCATSILTRSPPEVSGAASSSIGESMSSSSTSSQLLSPAFGLKDAELSSHVVH